MSLPVDLESDDYRFHKTLNNDILLAADENTNQYDMQFKNGDLVNITGYDSLANAICIAIMTRYKELQRIKLYSDFGCKVHENIKKNQSTLTSRIIENQTIDVLENMRRIKKINYIQVDSEDGRYIITFSVNSISDKVVDGSVQL